MKIRTDFVSNSSSSSCILSECKLFSYYSISTKDICDAIEQLGGKDIAKCYEAYSLPDEIDEAEKHLGMLLDEWDQYIPSNCDWDYNIEIGESFSKFINAICKAYNCYIHRGTPDELLENDSLPASVKDTIYEVRRRLEIKTANEVMHSKEATSVFHFDDNILWSLAGMDEELNGHSKFCTEPDTLERFFEILLNKLVEMGKLKLDDKDVLSKLYPNPNDPAGTYLDDDKYSAIDFIEESVLHFIAHEG